MTQETPKRACVIGWPIDHSKSPLIHTYWLKTYGIAGSYEKQAVAPEDLSDFVTQAWHLGLAGFNATIPHKQALMDLVEPDATAKQIGAINTVYRGPAGWIGTNTDGSGWWRSLNLKSPPATALVLGAGGAARAIVHTLRGKGVQVTLTNRTRSRAEGFGVQVLDWPGTHVDGRGFDLIVNTSACGMRGQNPLCLTALDPGTLVSDLVYTPLETQLLKSAKDLGGKGVDGLGMLLHQAAGGFERWFGQMPQVDEPLLQAVLAA